MKDAMSKHQDADVLISFASFRSVEESIVEAMQFSQIRAIAIIAEGMGESFWYCLAANNRWPFATGRPQSNSVGNRSAAH